MKVKELFLLSFCVFQGFSSSARAQVTFTDHLIVSNFDLLYVSSLSAVDLDQDNDLDLLATGVFSNDVAWFENNGSGVFTTRLIYGTLNAATDAKAGDVDHDGDIDVVATSRTLDDVVWFENNGTNTFTYRLVNGTFDEALEVALGDLDGDLDLDIVGGAGNERVTWWENLGGGSFTEHLMPTNRTDATVAIADFDGDDDLDVAANGGSVTIWYENLGADSFSENFIASGNYDKLLTSDVDSDGDPDLIGQNEISTPMKWWENDGTGTFAEHPISSSSAGYDFDVADIDGLNGLDVVANGSDIEWLANDGSEGFSSFVIAPGEEVVAAGDFDGDGDMDIASAMNDITWWENLRPPLLGAIDDLAILTGATPDDVVLYWSPAANASTYQVHASPNYSFTPDSTTLVTTTTDTMFTHFGIVPAVDRNYYVVVALP